MNRGLLDDLYLWINHFNSQCQVLRNLTDHTVIATEKAKTEALSSRFEISAIMVNRKSAESKNNPMIASIRFDEISYSKLLFP